MRYFGGLQIALCPRFIGEPGKEATSQNLFAQAAFWNALHLLAVCQLSLSIELRFFANSLDRTIAVYILFATRNSGQGNDTEILKLALQLMPKEFVCILLTAEELKSIATPPRPTGSSWRISRIHRRAQFVDLPSRLSPAAKATGLNNISGAGSRFSLGLGDQEAIRHLPEDVEDALKQMKLTRFCLPLLGDMQEFQSDRRGLFEELQACAPAVVSIGLHPFLPKDIEEDRQVATRFRRFVNALGRALANSGFAQLESLQRVFDRYLLTQNHICISTVRVAALSDHQALSIGHQLCMGLGGMKAFHIIPPSKNIDSLGEALANPETEFPQGTTLDDWKTPIERILSVLSSEQVETPTGRVSLRQAESPCLKGPRATSDPASSSCRGS
jgi:hypothetical protein